jgi:UDP-N-acetylglucosamine--N-acetylmuramyl-(pentapeptide) pyrophosphoryl-undecaprenol N-acetylglucosamine transferase
VIFATGGTGGHIYPAIAVANTGRKRGEEIVFLGQQGGMEERATTTAGFRFVGVRAGKWERGNPNPVQALSAVSGVLQALKKVRKERPGLIMGFGGYASFPGCTAATVLHIPLVLHEGNVFPGKVTRLFASRAWAVIGAQQESIRGLARARRFIHIPEPIRERRVPKSEARARLGLPSNGIVTLVMGGSQGSATLNRLVPLAYRDLQRATAVLHSTGAQSRSTATGVNCNAYQTVPYADAPLAWSAADLGITRSGVSTLAEAAFHGVPLIMLPFPGSANDHQLLNARAVETARAGTVLEKEDASTLARVWDKALEPTWLSRAAEAARSRSPEGAAEEIWRVLDEARQAAPTSLTEKANS